jgi:hypothetical protein
MAPKFISILRSLRTTPASVVNPFHGPSTVGFIPKLLPGSRTDAWFVPELELAQVRGTGDLWDVFSARFAWLPTAPADLIVKLCNLSAFPPDPIDVDESDDSNSYSEKDARIALRAEVVCFNGPLKALQGDIVPSFYGLFGCWQPGGAQQWCTMFEDVGIALTAADANDPDTR